MKVQDLQIGDWVYISPWDCEPHPSKVTAVNYNSWRGKDYCDWIDTEEWDELSPEEVAPIPLTDEIFTDNGFPVRVGAGGLYQFVYSALGTGVDFNIIRYVHELQHALRLCGIEKEVRL